MIQSPVKFAMLAEMMGRHPGELSSVEGEACIKLLHEATEVWHEARDAFGKLVEDTPVSKTDEFMIELAKVMGAVQWVTGHLCSTGHVRLPLRSSRVMSWRNELTFVQWQSMCTTVLSRKVKTEEDIDDGSFTTIDPLQLMGSVFKKLKIHENPTEYERALAEIVKYCKSGFEISKEFSSTMLLRRRRRQFDGPC